MVLTLPEIWRPGVSNHSVEWRQIFSPRKWGFGIKPLYKYTLLGGLNSSLSAWKTHHSFKKLSLEPCLLIWGPDMCPCHDPGQDFQRQPSQRQRHTTGATRDYWELEMWLVGMRNWFHFIRFQLIFIYVAPLASGYHTGQDRCCKTHPSRERNKKGSLEANTSLWRSI